MPIVRNKTEKINMASYLEAATERSEVESFKAASQLDLASLRDHKNMLLSEFLMGKVYSATGFGKSLFPASVFLNFAKGMIYNYYKSLL